VVVVDTDTADDKRLVAYLVAHQPQLLDLQAIQRFLAERLPMYMVPAAFVPLARLPLNANGKIDRRALPSPATAIAVHQAFIAPRTPAEATLAELWAEVLGLEHVSAADDFFALGGHSLALMRLSLRVRDTFQVDVPLRGFFEAPTVAEMAVTIAQHLAARDSRRIEPIRKVYQDDDDALLDQLSDADVELLLREALVEDRGM
jgi:acyl carrier protein